MDTATRKGPSVGLFSQPGPNATKDSKATTESIPPKKNALTYWIILKWFLFSFDTLL